MNLQQQIMRNLGFSPTPTSIISIVYQASVSDFEDTLEIVALALGIWTEARDNPLEDVRFQEMIRVGGTILNRVNTSYRGQSTIVNTILDPLQYSHFYSSTNPERLALESGNTQSVIEHMSNNFSATDVERWEEALMVARGLILEIIENPWSDSSIRHYFSPRSMDPPGTIPF
jgi:hypothetical protein